MLFEFSLYDIVLMAGVFTLIVLYAVLIIHLRPALRHEKSTSQDKNAENSQNPGEELIDPSSHPPATSKNAENLEAPPTPSEAQEPKTQVQPPQERTSITPEETAKLKEIAKKRGLPIPSGCPAYFGYLGELPKNHPIPDECLGCLKLMECLLSRPPTSPT